MPRVKLCRKTGCTHTIPYEQSNPYCSEHAGLYKQARPRPSKPRSQSYYNKFKRNKQANAFYQSKVWEHVAVETKRRAYFTCACCGHTYDRPGYLITDHIVPLRVDGSRKLDPDNLWVLCKSCHYWKTQLEEQLYQSQSLIENLDTAKRWNRERIVSWIMAHKK